MKNLYILLFFLCTSNFVFAQVKPFKISASSDVPCLLLVKQADMVSVTTDTIKAGNTFSRLNISVSKPRSAILETDQQQVLIWMIPGYSLDVKIENNQLIFGGQAALYADYYQNKQNNFINFCHFYYQRNPSFNEDAQGYINFLDSVTHHQLQYFKKYFTNSRSLYVKQFMDEELSSIYYENLSRKLLFGDYTLEKFKPYQKINGVQSAAWYNYSDKISFTDADHLRIHFFQQFAGQFVADISLKKQKELSPEFSFPQYMEIGMQIIEKLTAGGSTMYPVKAIFIARVLEEMERKNKMEWTSTLDPLITSLIKKSGNYQFVQLKEKLESFAFTAKP